MFFIFMNLFYFIFFYVFHSLTARWPLLGSLEPLYLKRNRAYRP